MKPADPIDGSKIVFNPKEWTARKLSMQLYPWPGKRVTFLTTRSDLDGAIVAQFLDRLDGGWQVYADLVGHTPAPFKMWEGKPTIVAVPTSDVTCGVGCGYIGVTGIELAKFYDIDYHMIAGSDRVFPHYCFYEMGRNYYFFGDRHSSFITGYAVFMRYVCMDALHCEDPESSIRKIIEEAEELFSKSDMSFLKGFTMQGGLGEKAPRVQLAGGKWLQPSDQPVLYASAMLKLRRDCGGDAWLKQYFAALMKCPEVKVTDAESALRQSLNWIVAASCAAHRDLSGTFAERWHFPLTEAQRQSMAAVAWNSETLDPAAVVQKLIGQ